MSDGTSRPRATPHTPDRAGRKADGVMTFGSLFSGIGGLDLGLERAGWECQWQVEIDDYARRVLTKHWPNVPKYGDVRDLNGNELEPVDLIAAGFPCQPVSVAGQRRGQADERWLWPDVAQLLRVVRPRFALLENVPGLLNRGMGDVLGDLATLGYDAEWQSLPAAAFGAPHLRWRIFIVAYASSVGRTEGQVYRHPIGQASAIAADKGEWGFWTARGASGRVFRVPDPGVCRMGDGLPVGLDRLRGLGNAVVPQIAEWVGRRIAACEVTR